LSSIPIEFSVGVKGEGELNWGGWGEGDVNCGTCISTLWWTEVVN